MNKVNRHQKEKIQQFVSITGTSDKSALAALKANDWNIEFALEFFYSRSPVDTRKIEDLYNRYKDPQHDMILGDGITKFCEDLQVDPSDVVTLVVSWHFRAATMCEYSRKEFVEGVASLGVDSVERLRSLLPGFRAELRDEHKFREIYNFAFGWAKEKGQKSLALDTAIPMWRLLYNERKWPHLDHWCHFLEVKHNKAISKDTWSQLLEFSRSIQPDLSNYDEEAAWPYLLDEFVEYLRENPELPRDGS